MWASNEVEMMEITFKLKAQFPKRGKWYPNCNLLLTSVNIVNGVNSAWKQRMSSACNVETTITKNALDKGMQTERIQITHWRSLLMWFGRWWYAVVSVRYLSHKNECCRLKSLPHVLYTYTCADQQHTQHLECSPSNFKPWQTSVINAVLKGIPSLYNWQEAARVSAFNFLLQSTTISLLF